MFLLRDLAHTWLAMTQHLAGLFIGFLAIFIVACCGAAEKHVYNIFTKLGLAPGGRDHRRVLAVLSYLATG